jgi:hypothetical protein
MKPPPPALDNAKVLEYAIVDSSVRYSGRLQLFYGGKKVGPVPGLAICRDPGVDGLLLFHCDEDWNVLGAQIWNNPDRPVVSSLRDVKERAETYYPGISAKWRSTT